MDTAYPGKCGQFAKTIFNASTWKSWTHIAGPGIGQLPSKTQNNE